MSNGYVLAGDSVEVLRDGPMDSAPAGAVSNKGEQQQQDEDDEGDVGLHGRVRITTRCMWIDGGRLLDHLRKAAEGALANSWRDASLPQIERKVATALRKASQKYINRRPEVIVIATEGSSSPPSSTNANRRPPPEENDVTVKSFPSKSQKWGDVKHINKVAAPSKDAKSGQQGLCASFLAKLSADNIISSAA